MSIIEYIITIKGGSSMKKLFTLMLTLLLVFSFIGCQKKPTVTTETIKESSAKETETTKEEDTVKRALKKIGPQDELLVYYYNLEPYFFTDESGPLKGIHYDIVNEVMKEMGQKFKWILLDPDINKALQDLKAGEVHMCPGLIKTPDQAKVYNFSNTILWIYFAMVVPKDSNLEIKGATTEEKYQELAGMTVTGGKPELDPVIETLRKYNKEIKTIVVPFQNDALPKVVNKEADIALIPDASLIEIEKQNLPLKPIAFYGLSEVGNAFSKSIDPEIFDRWNKAYDKLVKAGLYERLNKKYGTIISNIKPTE
jgi:ABC-type amino acid transport substrate-binding protein